MQTKESDITNPFADVQTLEDLVGYSAWASPSIIILRSHMKFDCGHDEAHVVRVARNALWFGQAGDFDVIVPGAILHDLVNVPKSDLENRSKASKLSAIKAIELLSETIGFKDDLHRQKIYNAIEAHSYSANVEPLSLEARAVQDGDRIDSLGLIGIARMFVVGGALGRTMFHPTDPIGLSRELDEKAYTLDHFRTKIVRLPGTMKTDIGKHVALHRATDMIEFIDKLAAEVVGSACIDSSPEDLTDFGDLLDSLKHSNADVVRYFASSEHDTPRPIAND